MEKDRQFNALDEITVLFEKVDCEKPKNSDLERLKTVFKENPELYLALGNEAQNLMGNMISKSAASKGDAVLREMFIENMRDALGYHKCMTYPSTTVFISSCKFHFSNPIWEEGIHLDFTFPHTIPRKYPSEPLFTQNPKEAIISTFIRAILEMIHPIPSGTP